MIGYTMLYAAVAAVPVSLAAVLEATFLRTHGRAERWVWAVGLVIALSLPLAVLTPPEVPLRATETPVVSAVVSELQPVLVLPSAPAADRSNFDATALLVALWLAASAALAARWSISRIELHRRRTTWSAQRVDGVPVLVSADVGPGVFGLWRPRIVIPSWVVALPTDQRAFVLRHETEHLRGRDHWLSALIRASRVVAPWNPLVWLLSAKLGRAVELDCDRRVLRADPNVAGYGATLLMVSEYRSSGVVPALAFAASELPLRERILAMTAPQRSLSAMGLGAALVVGIVLLGAALRVPVPAVGTPTIRLDQMLASPPQTGESLEAEAPFEVEPTAPPQQPPAQPQSPERLGVLQQLLTELPAATEPRSQQALSELLLIPEQGDDTSIQFDYIDRYGRPRPARIVRSDLGRTVDGTLIGFRASVQPIEELPRILNPEEILAAAAAEYPAFLRGTGVSRSVAVRFHIGESGEVLNAFVASTGGSPILGDAAERVAAVYRFSPGRTAAGPVALRVSHVIQFAER